MQAAAQDALRSRQAAGSIVNIISFSARRTALPGPVRGRESPACGPHSQCGYAHRFDRIRINGLNIGWTETEGEDATQREFHGQATTGFYPRPGYPWASSGRSLRSPSSWCSSSPTGRLVTGSVIDWDQNVLGAHD